LSKSKQIGIGVGVGIAATIVTLVLFTNVDDMVSETVSETASDVVITNPFKTYEYNTKEELVCGFKGDAEHISERILEIQNRPPEELIQKYSYVYEEYYEYRESGQFESDLRNMPPGTMPKNLVEILFPIYSEELSINPTLKEFFVDLTSGGIPDYEIRELDRIECP